MRTTLTLDPDVAQRLQARMADRNETLKDAVNRVLRAGLGVVEAPTREAFTVKPHACQLRAGIDPDKINQLVDELEVAEFLKKHNRC